MKKENKNITASEHVASPITDKKQWLFVVLFIFIAIVSVWAVVMQSRDFSLQSFVEYAKNASLPWLFAALLSMLGFIFFEAAAILVLCRAFGYPKSLKHGYIYSASDIYFSAITPSATGGQPASAYFMIKDGMNGMMATALLVANVGMYTLSIILIGAVCLVFRFDYFMQYSILSKILIVSGMIVQVGLLIFFYLLLKKDKMLYSICNFFLRLLCKMRMLRNYDRKREKLENYMEKYRRHSKLITGHKKALFSCLLFNLFQRISQIAVTMFVYAATTGDSLLKSFELWFWQGYVTLGSNCVPVPGAMGVSDYLMLDGFKNLMTESQAVNLELLCRSFSFYSCVIICGVSVLVWYCILKRRESKK